MGLVGTADRGTMLQRVTRLSAVLMLLWSTAPYAAVGVVDDMGRKVTLSAPARRIVSLAPHATELLFAAGAGDRVIGTARFSDYPAAARRIPRIGDAERLDMERLLMLKPDLVVAWHSSLPQATLERLTGLGLVVYISEPRDLSMIAGDMTALGRLAGTGGTAAVAARRFSAKLNALRERYGHRPPVRVFYQIWDEPLMTVNGEHFISHVLRLCGARNIFAGLKALSARVSAEAVVAANPQAIVTAAAAGARRDMFARWRGWHAMAAVRLHNFFVLSADDINRPGPRILQGAARLCRDMDRARRRIGAGTASVHTKSLSK